MTEAQEIINTIIQENGGIPIHVVSETNWTQYCLTLFVAIIGSALIFFYIWMLWLQPISAKVSAELKLRKIHKKTGRHFLIIKHSKQELFSMSMINTSTIMDVEEALIKFKGEPFDIILHTPGGSVFAAQRIVEMLKQYPGKIRCIVPIYAMSGGSLLALSCDEILLSNYGCLGPIDPQISSLFNSGSARSFDEVVKKKGRKSSDESVKYSFIGKQYTTSIRSDLHLILSSKIDNTETLEKAVDLFTIGEVEHSHQFTKSDLEAVGITTGNIDPEIAEVASKIITSKLIEGVFAI